MGDQRKPATPHKPKDKICKLNKDGKIEEIDALSAKPIVYCNKCRAKANDPGSVCNPRTLKA